MIAREPRQTSTVTIRHIACRDLRFEVACCGEGRTLVLCLHGYLEHAVSWRHQLAWLADQGFSAWAMNLRGYGRSSRPRSIRDYHIEHLLEDIDQVISQSGADDVILMGHDWGANLAWHYAARQRQPVKGLVAICCPHPVSFLNAMQSPGQALSSSYVLGLLTPGWAEFNLRNLGPYSCLTHGEANVPDAVRDTLLANLRTPAAITTMTHYYRAYVLDPQLQQRLHALREQAINIPTLVVSGGQDAVVRQASYADTLVHAPDALHWHFPSAHHWPHQQLPAAFNDVLAHWLEENL